MESPRLSHHEMVFLIHRLVQAARTIHTDTVTPRERFVMSVVEQMLEDERPTEIQDGLFADTTLTAELLEATVFWRYTYCGNGSDPTFAAWARGSRTRIWRRLWRYWTDRRWPAALFYTCIYETYSQFRLNKSSAVVRDAVRAAISVGHCKIADLLLEERIDAEAP